MTTTMKLKDRYSGAHSRTEDGAIANLMRVRAMGQGHATIYSYLCDSCGEISWSHRSNVCACSVQCSIDLKPGIGYGKDNPKWKGGKYTDERGYVLLSGRWEHPNRHPTRGTVAEHRVVMETQLGRVLARHENVHHKNGVRHDNRIDNLELWAVPQPYGQRVDDLVAWVIDNYQNELEAKLEVRKVVQDVIRRVTVNGSMRNEGIA